MGRAAMVPCPQSCAGGAALALSRVKLQVEQIRLLRGTVYTLYPPVFAFQRNAAQAVCVLYLVKTRRQAMRQHRHKVF